MQTQIKAWHGTLISRIKLFKGLSRMDAAGDMASVSVLSTADPVTGIMTSIMVML